MLFFIFHVDFYMLKLILLASSNYFEGWYWCGATTSVAGTDFVGSESTNWKAQSEGSTINENIETLLIDVLQHFFFFFIIIRWSYKLWQL